MHVLHVMEATIGGTRRHLVDLAREQRRCGLRVSLAVATLREERFLADLDQLRGAGCGVYELAMLRGLSPLADLRHLRCLSRILLDLRPDVVHTHSSKAGVLGRLASMQTGIGARVHTPHTMAFLFQGRVRGARAAPVQRARARAGARHAAPDRGQRERGRDLPRPRRGSRRAPARGGERHRSGDPGVRRARSRARGWRFPRTSRWRSWPGCTTSPRDTTSRCARWRNPVWSACTCS